MAIMNPTTVGTALKPVTHWENAFGFPLFSRFSHELDAMFDRFGMERPFVENTTTVWNPEIEMFTRNNELFVNVDVPGIKKDEIVVEVTKDHLVLRGKRKAEREEKKDGFYRTEFHSAAWAEEAARAAAAVDALGPTHLGEPGFRLDGLRLVRVAT